MDLQLKLSQKQVQKLILSPQMQQALHLLQLPLMELKQLIQKELLQNPLLEEADLSLNPSESSTEVTISEEDMAKIDKALDIDLDWKEYYHDVSDLGTTEIDEEKREFMQASITRAPSLQKHLLDQLYLNVEDERQRGIGEFIIGNINDDGYLESTLFEVALSFAQEETELEDLLSKLESAGFKSTPEKLLRYLKNLREEAGDLEKYLLWKLAGSNINDDDLHIASLILQQIKEDGTLQPTWQIELANEADPEHLEDVVGMIREVLPDIASDTPLDLAKIKKDMEETQPVIRIIDEHIKGIEEEAEQLLQLIQSFDPPGVGARDLKECLLIQLRARGAEDTLAAKIVQEHLEDLEHYKLKNIAKALGVNVEEVKKAAAQIRALQPKPGHVFDSEPPQYIIPDVILEKVDGQYQIMLNDDEIPTLRISPAYRRLLKEGY